MVLSLLINESLADQVLGLDTIKQVSSLIFTQHQSELDDNLILNFQNWD